MLFEPILPELDLRSPSKPKKIKISEAYHMAEIQLKYIISKKVPIDIIGRNNIFMVADDWYM